MEWESWDSSSTNSESNTVGEEEVKHMCMRTSSLMKSLKTEVSLVR